MSAMNTTARDSEQIESKSHGQPGVVDQITINPTDSTSDASTSSPEKSATGRVGTSIQDSGQGTEKTVTVGDLDVSSKNDRAQNYLNDIDWDLNKLEHKFTHVENLQWNITDSVFHELTRLKIPQDILTTPAQKTPFDVTRYWKASNILMKVVVKASPFYAGALVLGFSPLETNASSKRLINMNAQIYKVSKDESIEFSIPWRYPKGFLELPKETLGEFVISVLSPLKTGATNPNNISVAVYSAIEENKFKIPEIVPSSQYISHKLDKGAVVLSMPEAGKLSEREVNIITDINRPVSELVEQSTVMCAGNGKVGLPRVGHYQDAPSDLVQFLKRWRVANNVSGTVVYQKQEVLSFDYNNLLYVASAYLSSMYATWRGSLGLRVILHCECPVEGAISYRPVIQDFREGYVGETIGVHRFDNSAVGQIMIPYHQCTFIDYFKTTNSPNNQIYITLDSSCSSEVPYHLRLEVCLGDDFHAGIFTGVSGPIDTDIKRLFLKHSSINTPYIPVARLSSNVASVPQGGIFDFLGRAVENVLPVAEVASEIGGLLDAHMITLQPEPVFMRKYPYSIATDIHQFTERLLAVNHNGMNLPDKDCFGTDQCETDMYNLLTGTKSYAGIIPWKETDGVGDVLSLPGGILLPGPGSDKESLHDAVPAMFHRWTGSTTYIFDIVASEFHRGQLLFAYNFSEDTPSYKDATQTYFTSYDLSAGRGTIAITLPYLSPLPYMNVFTGTLTDPYPVVPGRLHIYVQNALRSTSSVASQIDIVVYKTYGSDFRLGIFGNDQNLPEPARSTRAAVKHRK